jgi:hypothetical protein
MTERYMCQWYDAGHTTILFHVEANWNWTDACEMVEAQIAMMNTVDHPVDTIFMMRDPDILKGAYALPSGNTLSQLRRLILMTHPNEQLVVFVGKNMLLEVLINTVSKVYKLAATTNQYRYVQTFDEALALVGNPAPEHAN